MRAHVARRERHRSADRTGRSGGVEKDPAPVREVPQGAGVRDVDGDRCPRTAEVAVDERLGTTRITAPDTQGPHPRFVQGAHDVRADVAVAAEHSHRAGPGPHLRPLTARPSRSATLVTWGSSMQDR